jgi:hypothetical protein
MPFVPDRSPDRRLYEPEPTLDQRPEPTWGETFSSAFGAENDMVNAWAWASRPRFKATPGFDIATRAKEARPDLWDSQRESIQFAESEEEMTSIFGRLDKENRDRDVLQRSGWGGTAAAVAAGVVSPTIFLPGLAAGKGAKAVASGFGWGFIGGAVQEIPLQLNQDTRTMEESAFSIGASTVLSGLLGSAVVALRAGERAVLEEGLNAGDGTALSLHEPAIHTGASDDVRRSVGGDNYTAVTDAKGRTLLRPRGKEEVPTTLREVINEPRARDGTDWQPRALEEVAVIRTPEIQKLEVELEAAQAAPSRTPDAPVLETAAKVAHLEQRIAALQIEEALPDGYTVKVGEDGITVELGKHEVGTITPGQPAEATPWLRELVQTGRTGDLDARIRQDPDEPTFTPEEADNANTPAVPTATEVAAQSGGAASTRADDPGALRTSKVAGAPTGVRGIAKVLDSTFVTRSPVLHNLLRTSGVGRWVMAQMADAGLGMERAVQGIPTTPGGTVENRVHAIWYAMAAQGRQALYDAYASYRLDMADPGKLDRLKVAYLGLKNRDGKLSRKEFHTEVTRAMWEMDTHPVPQIQEVAQKLRKELFDPIREAAQAAGILPEELKKFADPSWMTHNWDRNIIIRDPITFVNRIAAHYEEKLNEQWAKKLEKLNARQRKDEILAEDLARPLDEVEEMRKAFLEEEGFLNNAPENLELNLTQDTIASLRAQAAKANFAADRQALLADAKAMEEAAGAPLERLRSRRAEVRQRIRNLNRSAARMESRQADKLEKAERSEELQTNSLMAVARAGRRLLNNLDKWSDAKLNKEVKRLQASFEQSHRTWAAGERRLERMLESDKENDIRGLFDQAELQQARNERAQARLEKLADAWDLGRDALREMIEDELDEVLARTQRINSRRAVRAQRLLDQARQLDPKQAVKQLEDIGSRLKTRKSEFLDRIKLAGGDAGTLNPRGNYLDGKANFSAIARESAESTRERILGTYTRMPVMEVGMQGARGSQLLRTLDVKGTEFSDFMNTDMEDLIRTFTRTMGPDIELAKKFGDVNASKYIGAYAENGGKEGGELWEEMNRKLEEIAANPDLKAETKQTRSQEVRNEYVGYADNIKAVIGRLRHTWGLPPDPDAAGYRMANVVMNLNVLRYMNMVTVSSIPDLGRLVMRHGITSTFKNAIIPMITGLKEMKALKEEFRYANIGLETVTGMRAQSLLDITDEAQLGNRTKFEKGVEFLTAKQGVVATFSMWTDVMKRMAAANANAKLMDSIAALAQGKATKEQVTFLSDNGLGGKEALAIWDEVIENGGGARVNGVWLPNTEMWRNVDAKHAYRSALHREASITIVTPGVDKPLWTDSSLMGRMLSQFKGYSFGSTSRVAMAGLQQRDAAVVNGVAISLGLGMLSYYVSSQIAGGRQRETMQNAGLGRWADEAIDRSGVLGIFGVGRDLLSRFPATAPFVGFGGGRSTRRGGDNFMEALMGPTFDFGQGVAEVIGTMHDPTDHTWHEARKLAPYQSLIVIREFFDAIDGSNR